MARKQWNTPPAMQIDPAKKYRATIVTNRGTIELELSPEFAPKTVNNFVFLSREGFYDGVTFHRVISNFMIQGRSHRHRRRRSATASRMKCVATLKHETGVISMANAGPNTNGSQFFITHSPTPSEWQAYRIRQGGGRPGGR